eukprot:TRINITY_DN20483_c0_g1_i1.p1 TRINITY_DN20483_c0_g1~~TRINITY_DN20483_c0_g1_i1.p1  ORF type:complete len:509 (+),score=65.28 TRINITY_DN20483_c0_g1_i1:74-1600(+)
MAHHCGVETAALLKDGHMTIAKDPAWKSDRTSMRFTRHSRGRTSPARFEPQAASHLHSRPPLRPPRRPPELPVSAGSAPQIGVVSLHRFQEDARDWRLLAPDDITRHFEDLAVSLKTPVNRFYPTHLRRAGEESKHFEGVATAVAVGCLQACTFGTYWAPHAGHPEAVECQCLRKPCTWAFMAETGAVPPTCSEEAPLQGSLDTPRIDIYAEKSPLDVCLETSELKVRPRIAVVRFVPEGCTQPLDDSTSGLLANFRSSQLLLQTTYMHGLRDLPRQLHKDPLQALNAGAVLHTTNVSVLRGPIEDGAIWLQDPVEIDVLLVAIQRHPRCDDQGQYARIVDKARAVEAIDRVFACAAARSIEMLVFTPLCLSESGGCAHPAADAGDLLRRAALAHAHAVPRVCLCQEYRGQVPSDTWNTFAAAVAAGRAPPEHRELVPLGASPFLRPGWVQRKTPRVKCPYPPWPLAATSSAASQLRTPRGEVCAQDGASFRSSGAALGAGGRAILSH